MLVWQQDKLTRSLWSNFMKQSDDDHGLFSHHCQNLEL